jgi:SAM-dependent methyltransferase
VSEWWEEFFDGLWQDVQLGSSSPTDDRAAAELVARAARLEPGSRVLDVPCGNGRIALELAAAGHVVTGVDLTPRFVDEAKRSAAARGVDATLLIGDMRDLPFAGEFDAAVNFGGSFGYFRDDRGESAAVAAVARALRPGGRFVVDTLTVETVLPRFQAERSWTVGDLDVATLNQFDSGVGRMETEWTITAPDGRTERRTSSIRLYAVPELTALLAAHGFERVDALDPATLEPFGPDTERLLIVGTLGT